MYHQITTKICDLASIGEVQEDLCVVLPTAKDRFLPIDSARTDTTFLLAGHHITLQHLQDELPPADNVVVVYGEPYGTIPHLAKNRALVAKNKGKAILGDLYDPKEYTAVPDENPVVVTSLGCMKKCAYCTYGSINSRLYGSAFSRRSRPWQDIESELIASLNNNVDCFQMTASQFLSDAIADNSEIRSLAFNWNSAKFGRPRIAFTISPVEVLNNRPIIEEMSRSFRMYPRLSVDSFDDPTLALFDRDYDAATAMKALEFLAALHLPLQINYIFMRPDIKLAGIGTELKYLKQAALATSYLNVRDKLMLAYEIFSSRLQVYPSAPIAAEKGFRDDYENDLPLEMMAVMACIHDNMRELISAVRKGEEADPLLSMIQALEKEMNIVT